MRETRNRRTVQPTDRPIDQPAGLRRLAISSLNGKVTRLITVYIIMIAIAARENIEDVVPPQHRRRSWHDINKENLIKQPMALSRANYRDHRRGNRLLPVRRRRTLKMRRVVATNSEHNNVHT